MKNQLVRSLSVFTVILSLGESKKYLLETDGQPEGGADGDDYTFISPEWMEEVPCEERRGEAMCPEAMVCEIQKCKQKPYEPEPWDTKVPCKERVGNLTCPEFAKICK
ncbi:uncharacterized protein LOC111713676 [Eurytemora carolleeae]|uniref:uncharacterized protein LOC111713676 n=1 Tax=Eurytemora carolleeae TaxID=1294199 RepID=UPI000C76C34D|nr:uncharacterized protein LOC111713676 [Eurytemora carolleeae]|eukprot:XP_023344371.1 uncharacterized protein LOC111713676 [Eurytemora affinis]